MDDLVELWAKPTAEEMYMIAGWRQWADAGSISSGLPRYLIALTRAQKIGEIKPHGFYLFQIPGAHHFLRPEIKLDEGYRKELRSRKNELFYWAGGQKGLLIFVGDEPHMSIERYAEAFFNMVQELKVKRVAAVGGVYGSVPYGKDREISCVYSLPHMKSELTRYAVKFSNYEGGVSIGTYLADLAEQREIEYLSFYALVPAYDFSQLSTLVQGVAIENDYKAWYDLLRRFNHMFGLKLDLSDLESKSAELASSMEARISELETKIPQLRDYMAKLAADFTEMSFVPLDEVWERELGDLLKDI